MEKTKLQWHPAFSAALRITLQDEMKYLEMHEEYLLTKKPLQMDVLLIKKTKNVQIEKSIGQIFRAHNIIEYKSPEDYLSINDFYKVYAYACLYQSDTDKVNEIDPSMITITFVCSHYPRELLRHLAEVRNIISEDKGNGIYYLKGDPIHMQLLVTRANWKEMEVERNMCDALKELFSDELEEATNHGIILTKQVFKLSADGLQPDEIAEKCGISLEQVNKILE